MKTQLSATIFLLAVGSAIPGCSNEPGRAANVDASRARESLKTALESWKKGEKTDALKAASPKIVVQDMDWENGAVLVGYQIENDGIEDTANLRVPVSLTLRDGKGVEAKKSVNYVVGTSPIITVFRELFP